MKRGFLFIITCLLCSITALAESFACPDYESIQALGQKRYDGLIERFQAQDTTLSITELQAIYYGSAFYGNPSRGLNYRRVNAIYEANGHEGVLVYVDSLLSSSPLNLGALRMRFIAAFNVNDTIATHKYFWLYDKLLDAIYATGDALSEQTALHVVCIDDEYTIMNYVMKVEMENQKLTSTMCDMFDVTTKNGKKTQVYFDVQLILALENQMFSTDKKPFTFKYKKPKK